MKLLTCLHFLNSCIFSPPRKKVCEEQEKKKEMYISCWYAATHKGSSTVIQFIKKFTSFCPSPVTFTFSNLTLSLLIVKNVSTNKDRTKVKNYQKVHISKAVEFCCHNIMQRQNKTFLC